MNILHTAESYGDQKGGVAKAVTTISQELVRRGHAVTVLTGGGSRSSEIVRGVRVEHFPISGSAVRGISGSKESIAEYRSFLAGPDFDVMLNYAAQSWATDLVFGVLEKIRAKKIIVPCGYSHLRDLRYGEYFRSLPEFLRHYDHIVYLSQNYQDKKFSDSNGVSIPGRFSVIPNCADPAEFLSAPEDFRDQYGIRERIMVVGVSNHAYAKRHEYFWTTAALCVRERAAFVLIGSPDAPLKTCYGFCRAVAASLPGTRMFSNIPRADVIAALKSADIFLHTSRTECDPIVMYEAFAAGLPIVATPAGSVPEHSPPVLLGNNPLSLARHIRTLVRDERMRDELGEKGRKLAGQFTLMRMVDAYETLYRSLVSGRNS